MSAPAFFNRGITVAFLKYAGTTPVNKGELSRVIREEQTDGRRAFRIGGGQVSSKDPEVTGLRQLTLSQFPEKGIEKAWRTHHKPN